MDLRLVAERDLARVLESTNGGFGWPVVLTAPDGYSSAAPLFGLTQDIGKAIDPGTGELVSGRTASAAVRISSLYSAGYLQIPEGVPSGKPWRVDFTDVNARKTHSFKVVESYPDRALGVVVLVLEAYRTL